MKICKYWQLLLDIQNVPYKTNTKSRHV